MAVDLTTLTVIDIEYTKVVAAIKQKFRCSWDDQLHDSFRLYVDQETQTAEKVHNIRVGAEETDHSIDDLDIDGLLRRSEEISNEVETI